MSPPGTTREAFWELITAGRTATRQITAFDPEGFRSQIAAEADFDPIAAGLTEHERQRQDRYIQFATAAALEAVEDSAGPRAHRGRPRGECQRTFMLEPTNPDRIAVSLGSAVGGTIVLENGFVAVPNRGQEWLVDPDYAPPFLYEGLISSSLASEIAYKFGAAGPSVVVSTGCTSGLDSIGYGHQMIQDQEADVVIAGASESPISRSRWPASIRSGRPRAATMTRPTPRARSTAIATGS